MLPKYDCHLKVLYEDADIYIYNVHTHDVYKNMKENIDLYDTSDTLQIIFNNNIF